MNINEPNKKFDVWLALYVMGWSIAYIDYKSGEKFNGTYETWDKENRRIVWTGFVTNEIKDLHKNMLCDYPQIVWEPTVNVNQAIMALEFYFDSHPEYSYVELVYESDWDLGWYSLFACEDDTKYRPNAHGYKYGLAFAICVSLWNAINEV